ncbi:MAG: FHA domain-containing protein [Myxococcota bacterium]
MSKPASQLAQELLDRFFRDAEGRTNRQIDVYFTLQDLNLTREASAPAMEFLVNRGLLNTFGPDIAFLTDAGVSAVMNERDIAALPEVELGFAPSRGNEEPSRPSGPREATRPRIVHIGLEGEESVVELAWTCRVGRADDNEITVADQRASKHHAEFRFENDAYVLYDLDSANGTLHNGEYVVEPTLLRHDDEVVIGRTLLLFQAPHGVERPEGEPPTGRAPPRAVTPHPALSSADRLHSGEDRTPIPPSFVTPAGDIQPLGGPGSATPEGLPDAILEPQMAPKSEAEGDAADAGFLNPEDLEALDPSSPFVVPGQKRRPRPNQGMSDVDLDSDDLAATLMTSRKALFGTDNPLDDPETRKMFITNVDAPPKRRTGPASSPHQATDEPALITLLAQLQDRLEDDVDPDRQELLEAVQLIRTHPRIRRMARLLEDEVFGG